MNWRFHIGAFDWDHALWRQTFYPEDLPPEWRLIYYANEFPLVLVPEPRWLASGASGWVDEVHDRFVFYLQIHGSRLADADYADALRQAAHALGAKMVGLVDFDKGARAPLSVGAPLYRTVDAGDGAWQAGDGAAPAFILRQAALGTLRDQRGVLEALSAQTLDCPDVPLFLAGDPPDVQSLRGLRQLAMLMGLA